VLNISDNMLEALLKLGLSKKEASVFLALLEYGTQPASVIAKRTHLPRPTVLYLFEHLLEQGYIRKSQRGRTQYFYAEAKFLKEAKLEELNQQKLALEEAIPLLEEVVNPFSSPPKIQIFEGLGNCRKAYSLLLESSTDIYEFAAHDDLLKMGDKFMTDFIAKRVKQKISLHAICRRTKIHEKFATNNENQLRTIEMFSGDVGETYSSISIFDNKILLLNLQHDDFAVLIENKEMAETLKTLYRLTSMGLQD
jgi:sugar-specific transcriptional regulator TrmB